MQTEFTPLLSFLGGALIGVSAVLLMLTHGRIAGISGIVSKLLPPDVRTDHAKQGLYFIAGLLLAAPLFQLVTGGPSLQTVSTDTPLLIVAGIFVGFGSVYGNGCTSGHGVCGISRLSPRSLVATCTFMAAAFVTVTVMRHVLGG